jgi:MFS family permease
MASLKLFEIWWTDSPAFRSPEAAQGTCVGRLRSERSGQAAHGDVYILGGIIGRPPRLGAGVRSAPRDALIASSVDSKEEARGFGLEALGENAGAFLGPLLTLLLLSTLHVELRTVFYLALVPSVFGLLVILLIRERSPTRAIHRSTYTLSGLSPLYWKFLVATAIFSVGNSSNSFLILRSQEIGMSVVLVSALYAGFNLVAALAAYPSGWLADKAGRKLTLLGFTASLR